LIKRIVRRLLPATVREHRIFSGPLAGLRIASSWRNYPTAILGSTEHPLLEWLSRNVQPGEIWIDAGANAGYTALQMARRAGPSGRVFGFEPMPEMVACLARTAAANGFNHLTAVPLALGESCAVTMMETAIYQGMADPTTAPRAGSRETIFEIAFDVLWPQLGKPEDRIAGIKIDVNGSELSVLRGMRRTLTEHRPKLAIEIHRPVDRGEFLELLKSLGYVPAGNIDPSPPDVYLDDHSYEFRSVRQTTQNDRPPHGDI
jgi:FkbM family methyltransferase